MCLDQCNVKNLSLEVWGSNLDNESLGFQTLIVKILILLKFGAHKK
jgi:hypothetical protein